jgi:GPH family glycoside/pentoside/hexuronide:cation symporter
VLKRLERNTIVSSRIEQGEPGKPARTTYHIAMGQYIFIPNEAMKLFDATDGAPLTHEVCSPTMDSASPNREHLPLKTKLAYGAGDMGTGITATVESFVFLIFLTNVAGLSPGRAGTVLLVGRIWDAINDPVVGILSDRTRFRWGRRHTWMLFGSVPLGLSFFLLWIVPDFSQDPRVNEFWRMVYYSLMLVFFDTAFTAVLLPYAALTPELTQDYDERTMLNSFRFAFSMGGSILGLALGAGLSRLFAAPHQQALRYLSLGAVCAVLSVIPIYVCVWGTKERYAKSGTRQAGLLQELASVRHNRPFLFVMGIYLFSWVAFGLTASILPYYVVNWMRRDDFFVVALVVQSTAVVMLFVWSRASKRLGKQLTYMLGMAAWIGAQIGLFFLDRDQVALLYGLAAIAGVGVAVAYLIPWSMLPDVVDLDELGSGQRREGVYYSFMVLLQKVGLGLGLFVVGQVLEFYGFVEGRAGQPPPEQPASALQAIRWVIGPLPALLLIGGLILTGLYPLSRKAHDELLRRLEEKGRE